MTSTPIPAEAQVNRNQCLAAAGREQRHGCRHLVSPVSALEVSCLKACEGNSNLRNDMQHGPALASCLFAMQQLYRVLSHIVCASGSAAVQHLEVEFLPSIHRFGLSLVGLPELGLRQHSLKPLSCSSSLI